MRSRPRRYNHAGDTNTAFTRLLDAFFRQAREQFGDAVKSFWFYEGELCPGCQVQPLPEKLQGGEAVAINAFIYRPRGVLIGYFLCETCANFIFKEAQKNPYKETPLHADIERNLTAAYHKHLASLDA